ncbi:MAG TPA: lytic transglycosylase domain-containing protein [Solirubrobacteraceae bacterium]|jgi:soluble lytic murein transglycosylase|nr:lytic transglycosylase domain-containing protein [Solirubrobacteraceae bacterium]
MTRSSLRTVALLALAILLAVVVASMLHTATRDLALPLSDAAIIREQAAAKDLDPALIAAVIYAETKFDPRPSAAGAEGLMQILPSTAYYLAHLSGGVSFTAGDLADPAVNVAYGSYYLRYLLDRFDGNEMLAVAAYNGGITNVDRWEQRAGAAGHRLAVEEIPFPQTREYVKRVLSAQRAYRATYPRQLGIE